MTYRDRKKKRSRRGGGGRSMFGIAFTVILVLGGVAVAGGVGWVLAVASQAPGASELRKNNPGSTSVIFAADGTRLGFVSSDTLREPIRFEDMPKDIQNATVAIEDENFYQHNGIDFAAIARAAIRNFSAGGTVQGGSTITQQLARTLYIDDPERNISRKIVEAKIAMELEDAHTKEWILQQYLNTVPYGTVNGRTALGIEAAAETFFGKKAKDLTLPESALIAGLPQAPSQYNPFLNARAAVARRNEVLTAMAKNGMITEEAASEAQAAPLDVKSTDKFTTKREGYFFDYVQQVLIDQYGVETLRQGGLRVYTTIDPALQDAGRTAINSYLSPPVDPSGAVVAIDPTNGAIRAMASSGTYGERDFNLAAQGHRQPGSTFKVMVLTAAVREGIDPKTTYYESKSPVFLDIGEAKPWEVKTYSGSSAGNISLEKATLLSDNSVYAQLIEDVGPEKVKETAELLGITTHLDGYYGEGLGGLTIGVSPLEMASAYATLASGGIKHQPHAIDRIEFPDGTTKEFGNDEGERVLTDGQAYAVTDVLRQNVIGGTGTAAAIGCPDGTAGKTGTTDEASDVWFVGYTPQMSTAVWVGYPDDRRPIDGGTATGGGKAAPIWHDFMTVANPECEAFPTPTDPADLKPFDSDNTVSGEDMTTETTSTEEDKTKDPDADPDFFNPDTGGGGNGGGFGRDAGGGGDTGGGSGDSVGGGDSAGGGSDPGAGGDDGPHQVIHAEGFAGRN